jgi:hypothetical protein
MTGCLNFSMSGQNPCIANETYLYDAANKMIGRCLGQLWHCIALGGVWASCRSMFPNADIATNPHMHSYSTLPRRQDFPVLRRPGYGLDALQGR